ncbi:hypothetical protein OC842_006661, partial [Tilletia horrida]
PQQQQQLGVNQPGKLAAPGSGAPAPGAGLANAASPQMGGLQQSQSQPHQPSAIGKGFPSSLGGFGQQGGPNGLLQHPSQPQQQPQQQHPGMIGHGHAHGHHAPSPSGSGVLGAKPGSGMEISSPLSIHAAANRNWPGKSGKGAPEEHRCWPEKHHPTTSGSGVAVFLGGLVAAYALRPGWRDDGHGGRDIMWAEAVDAELGVRHLVQSGVRDRRVRIHNDNTLHCGADGERLISFHLSTA